MANKELTIKEFILDYLRKEGEACIHDMFKELTTTNKKRLMKYSSFRTEVAWLKKKKYIRHTRSDPDMVNPEGKVYRYGKSFYALRASGALENYRVNELKRGRPKTTETE
jgi:hypothetical protein